jgi:hypothetical protein
MRMFYPQDSGGKPLNVPNGALKKLEGSIWEKQLAKNSRPPAKYDVHLQSSSQLSNEETIGSPSRVLEPRWVPIFFSIPRWVSTTRGRGISRVAPIGTSLGLDVVLPLKSDSRDSWHIRREHNNYDVLDIYIYIYTYIISRWYTCMYMSYMYYLYTWLQFVTRVDMHGQFMIRLGGPSDPPTSECLPSASCQLLVHIIAFQRSRRNLKEEWEQCCSWNAWNIRIFIWRWCETGHSPI